VSEEIAAEWDKLSASYQSWARLPTDVATYGPDIPTEADLRLLGDVRGKRILELGCGGAQASIAFVRQGASAIGIDLSAEQIAFARSLCEQQEVRVELRQGDLADLAFLRPGSIDVVFSAYAFPFVEDLNRVFRQVHRVLKVGAPLVFSLPHPADDVLDAGDGAALAVARSYFDRGPVTRRSEGYDVTRYHHSFADLYMGLHRASYRVDLVLEPEPAAGTPRSHWWRESLRLMPSTLIMRARKEGN
jgi:SAM-dependent methyltransferase